MTNINKLLQNVEVEWKTLFLMINDKLNTMITELMKNTTVEWKTLFLMVNY